MMNNKQNIQSSDELARDLTGALTKAGAALVGLADLSPSPVARELGLPVGLAIAAPFDPSLARRPGPQEADKSYVAEYFRRRDILDDLAVLGAEFLVARGFKARGYGHKTYFDGVAGRDLDSGLYLTALYQHKTTALRAGLGWIGKMGVLVNPDYGPHLWLATVLTDAPLPTAQPVTESACGRCRRCQEACPAGAVKGRLWNASLSRDDMVDIKKCQAHRRSRAGEGGVPMCGLCLAACPLGAAKKPKAALPAG